MNIVNIMVFTNLTLQEDDDIRYGLRESKIEVVTVTIN